MPEPSTATMPALLDAAGLVLRDGAVPVNLQVSAGEIVGLAGLEGHGQEWLLESLAGFRQARAGEVAAVTDGARHPIRTPKEALRAGVVYLPRDRKTQGIFPPLSILDNFALPTLPAARRWGLVSRRRVRRRYERFQRELGIVAASPAAPITSLSGGNQQKVLLARWLAAEPSVLLLNDATRGVDLNTRRSLYDVFRSLARGGRAVVLLSTELEELLEVCDRVVVFREAAVSAELAGSALTMDRIIAAMFGRADDH